MDRSKMFKTIGNLKILAKFESKGIIEFMKLMRVFYVGSVVFLGLIFLTSGMGKLFAGHKFPGIIGPVWLEERLREHGLGLFGKLIGYTQWIIGFMVLTWRYRRLALIMLVPMLVGILGVTVSLEWRGTPYVVLFLLALNAGLVVIDRHQYIHLITGKSKGLAPDTSLSCKACTGIWMGSLILNFISIQASYYSHLLGWVLVALAVFTGVLSSRFMR